MRALVYDPAVPQGIRLADVPEPEPRQNEALVRVGAVSLNFGELAFKDRRRPGDVLGNDAAGVVVRAAADGSGPAEGSRVATFGGVGGWAELRAADTANLAVVPEGVDLGAAAALPAAGVTAAQAVRRLGTVTGRRVLITGASGGVGRFAVQLAARAGAHVIASVGGPARGAGLTGLGAAEVVVGLGGLTGTVYGVLDNVGGSLLAEAFHRVEDGGVALSIGMASLEPTVIDWEAERVQGRRKRIEPFAVAAPFAGDLAGLLDLLARGALDPQVGWRGPWERAQEAAKALFSREVLGKAILDLPRT
nr:zinc-binding dehydrogenase [Microtetraspora sp. NBRC 13810]